MKATNRHQSAFLHNLFQIIERFPLVFACVLTLAVSASAIPRPQSEGQSNHPPRFVAKQSTAASKSLSKEEIQEARELLDQLGYWVDADAGGKNGALRHALIAFQKVEGRKRTGVLTDAELDALRGAHRPPVLKSGYPHIEIDLDRQVLFMIDCGEVAMRILPISSGSGELFTQGGVTRRAITPVGKFEIYRKVEGWRKSPLGLLYYPNYIDGGIAIHGNPSVPSRPASHGCIRIPMFAAREFSELATIGMEVLVYNGEPLTQNF
jgi:hypothetical protein